MIDCVSKSAWVVGTELVAAKADINESKASRSIPRIEARKTRKEIMT